MDQELALYLLSESVKTAIFLSGPILLTGLVIGFLVSIVQSATQIQELTLTFIPKMLGVLGVLILGLPYFLNLMLSFTEQIFKFISIITLR